MKHAILRKLKETGLYHYLYYHFLGGWVERWRNPSISRGNNGELEFYCSFLPDNMDLVFDIGANIGLKSKIFLRLSRKVIAVEPAERHVRVMKYRFLGNRRIEIVQKAVAEEIGTSSLYVSSRASGYNTLHEKWKEALETGANQSNTLLQFDRMQRVTTTTLEQLIKQYGLPDFIKIDVEGYEWNVIRTLKRPVRCATFEANLPEFQLETIKCVQHLASLDSGYRFNYATKEQLELKEFVPAEQIIMLIQTNDLPYMEVLALLNPGSVR